MKLACLAIVLIPITFKVADLGLSRVNLYTSTHRSGFSKLDNFFPILFWWIKYFKIKKLVLLVAQFLKEISFMLDVTTCINVLRCIQLYEIGMNSTCRWSDSICAIISYLFGFRRRHTRNTFKIGLRIIWYHPLQTAHTIHYNHTTPCHC